MRVVRRIANVPPQGKWWTTALPSMTGTWWFPSFYRWKIKLLYLFLRLLFQISPRNHNCNVLNVFLMVHTLTVLSTGSARVVIVCLNFLKLSVHDLVINSLNRRYSRTFSFCLGKNSEKLFSIIILSGNLTHDT